MSSYDEAVSAFLQGPRDTATAVDGAIVVRPYALPDGVRVLESPYNGTVDGFRSLPESLQYGGLRYGKASHNSDTFLAVYRSDVPVAMPARG